MRKKVLLAEQSNATRSVAETILRQSGFEVISVTDGARAADVLSHGRPDLIIAGADLAYADRPLYQHIQQDKTTSTIPLLLFADAGGGKLPIAAEQVIPRPFDPREFLDRVRVFSGDPASAAAKSGKTDETGTNLEDEFLDAALGVDSGSIQITESEILDRSTKVSASARARKSHDDHSGLGFSRPDEDEQSESGRVESLTLNDSQTDIRRPGDENTAPPADSSDGGLDILDDQYDLQADDGMSANREHDYQWFIDSMRDDVIDGSGDKKPGEKKPTASASDELVFTDTADTLEPFKMPGETRPTQPATPPASKQEGAGVEKFIDEFKKEIEKFHAEEPESVTLRNESPTRPIADTEWEETLENVTPEKVELFTRRLAADLAERIAERIVSKIDSAKLLQLIKTEIMTELRSRRKS